MSVIWSGVTEQGAVVPVQVDETGKVVATAGASGDYVLRAGDTMTGDLTVPNIIVPGTGVIEAMQTPKAMVQFGVRSSGAVTINANYNIADVVYSGTWGELRITFTNAIPGVPVVSASAATGLVNTSGAAFVYTRSGDNNQWSIGTFVVTSSGTLVPETSVNYHLVWYGF